MGRLQDAQINFRSGGFRNQRTATITMSDLRPQKTGWKQLKKMTKEELLYEVQRLDEVLEITARRLDSLILLLEDSRDNNEKWMNRFRSVYHVLIKKENS